MNAAALLLALLLAPQDPGPKVGEPYAVTISKPDTTYWCYVPPDQLPGRQLPLVLLLHGAGDTAQNFLRIWTGEARARGFLLAAAKSRGAGWDVADGDLVLAVLQDMRKSHPVDVDRVVLLGYSSGAHMSVMWGWKHLTLFRAVGLLAGGFSPPSGKDVKAAAGRTSIFVCCGENDPNLAGCKEVAAAAKKDGFDVETNWVKGMAHSPPLPEVYPWFFERFEGRLSIPAERVGRARKAMGAKRWVDAIAEYQAAAESTTDAKAAKTAKDELARIEKAGNDWLAQGQAKLEKGDAAGAKKALEEAAKYVGLDCAVHARRLLDESK